MALVTRDGGATWQQQHTGNVFELFGIGFIDALQGYIVGSNATLIETEDGGGTWGGISIEAETGQIQRLQFDEAIRWKRAVGFYDLHFSTPQHGWGVGELGKILHTKDGGLTWQSQDLGELDVSYNNLYGVYFVDANVGWTVGEAGTIIKTDDGGETWIVQQAEPNELRAVFALTPPNCVDCWG